MWLFTQHGMYSIVRHRDQADSYLIRARVKIDLLNLVSLTGIAVPIEETPHADYPYRMLVSTPDLDKVKAALFASIDYPNFKSRVHAKPDQEHKSAAYMDVWETMRTAQAQHQRRAKTFEASASYGVEEEDAS